MGCQSSKDIVSPPETDSAPGRPKAWSTDSPSPVKKPISASSTKSRISNKSNRSVSKIVCVLPKSSGTEVEVLKRTLSKASLDSACDENSRGSSASSKVSNQTTDSGLDVACPGMITELSNEVEVKKVEELTRPSTPDLVVSGLKIEPKKKKKDKKQQSEQEIISELKTQGLLTTPSEKGASGMSFEVMIAQDFDVLKRAPPRLASLKKRKSKKKSLTKEQVEAKLDAARDRKKKREAERIQKLNTSTKEKQVQESLDTTVEQQRKQTAEKVSKDNDKAIANREAHALALKEKMEQKKRHAVRVRLLKLERLAEPQQEDGEEAKAIPGDPDSLPSNALVGNALPGNALPDIENEEASMV